MQQVQLERFCIIEQTCNQNLSPSLLHPYHRIINPFTMMQRRLFLLLTVAIQLLSRKSTAFVPTTSRATSLLERQQQLPLTTKQQTSSTQISPIQLLSPRRSRNSSSLGMISSLTAVAGVVSGGIFAGGLHAIAGESRIRIFIPCST